MILVDTTVWIDFFAGRDTTHVASLESALAQHEDICICGVVLTEVLQGIKEESEFKRVRNLFETLIFLPMAKDTFVLSAQLYRALRSRGLTVRKTVDCLIAAVAIENEVSLLHNDRDFDPIQQHCGLKTIRR